MFSMCQFKMASSKLTFDERQTKNNFLNLISDLEFRDNWSGKLSKKTSHDSGLHAGV